MGDEAPESPQIVPENRAKLSQEFIDHMFKPGQSGNPGGKSRKPITEKLIEKLFSRLAGGDADELANVIQGWLKAAKAGDMTAIREMLDRVEGKVPQKVADGNEDDAPIQQAITIRFV